MWITVLCGFVLAGLVPWVHRRRWSFQGKIFAVVPAVLFATFASWIPDVAAGTAPESVTEWVPALRLELALRADGLSVLFALLVTGVGTFVFLYSAAYLAGHPQQGRFFVLLFAFQASMLGLVLADDVLLLFVFWELTSVFSYLLIGFDHEEEKARKSALQALLVTALGGLALLFGLLLLGEAGGTHRISELAQRADVLSGHPLTPIALVLVLVGAFTKSAQFPFHFWLPNAMSAPTPASAFLHAATMVKAGVYLLLRLYPALGESSLWSGIVVPVGAVTMLVGAVQAVRQTAMKKLLAYTTVSALGSLVLLVGIGGSEGVQAALVFLVAHAAYKGCLFLVAGSVTHETGEKDLSRLGGLHKSMPLTATAAVVAGLSMAGLPPTLGFLGKEGIFRSALHAPFGMAVAAAALIAGALIVAATVIFVRGAFFGSSAVADRHVHETPWPSTSGPLVLGFLGLVLGVVCGSFGETLVASAVVASSGERGEPLHLWHGFDAALFLELLAVAGGLALVGSSSARQWLAGVVERLSPFGPERAYGLSLEGFLKHGARLTRAVQSGYLRRYLAIALFATVVLTGGTLFSSELSFFARSELGIEVAELVVAGFVVAATVAVVRSQTRLAAVAVLGVVGYGVAILFVFFGAPDLALTQFVIETLTVILFVLVFYRLPRFTLFSGSATRLRDLVLASSAGALMSVLVLRALSDRTPSRISPFFIENAVEAAHGHNVVNVILTDFRGLDTLGEITVLAVAAIGVLALLRARGEEAGS